MAYIDPETGKVITRDKPYTTTGETYTPKTTTGGLGLSPGTRSRLQELGFGYQMAPGGGKILPTPVTTPTKEVAPGVEEEKPEVTTLGVGAAVPGRTLADIQAEIQRITGQVGTLATQAGQLTAISQDDLAGATPLDMPPAAGAEGADSTFGTVSSMLDWWKTETERYREEAKTAREVAEKARGELETAMEERPSTVAEIERLRGELEVPEQYQQLLDIMPEIESSMSQLIRSDASYQRGQLGIETRFQGRPGAVMRGEQRLLERQYNIDRSVIAQELSAKAAIAEMYRGNINLARSLISDSVNAMVYDTTQKISDYKYLLEYHEDYVSTLDTNVQNGLNTMLGLLQEEEEAEREDYKSKLELWIDAKSKGIDLGTIEDLKTTSFEEFAGTYAEEVPAMAEVTTKMVGSPTTGYSIVSYRTTPQGAVEIVSSVPVPGVGAPDGRGFLPGAAITPDQLSPLAYSVYVGTLGIKDLTPTMKAEVAPELTAVGYTSAITAESRQQVGFIKSQMALLMGKYYEVPGHLKGYLQGYFAQKTGARYYNSAVTEFDASVGIVGMALTRLFEKGRISDQDRIFYMSLMPNLRMSGEAAEAGQTELIRLLEEKLINQVKDLQTETITPSSAEEDYITNLGY